MTGGWSRNSPRSVPIRLLEAARFYVPVVFLWQSTVRQVDGWPATAVTTAFWVYTCVRVLSVPASWWATRYQVTAEAVRLTTGLLTRRDLSVGWDDVAAVQVSRPWTHRLLRVSAVRLETGAQGRVLVLEAVPDAVAEEVQRRARVRPRAGGAEVAGPSPGAAVGEPSPAAGAAPVDGEVVYEITPRDYLLISVTYGQFVLVVPVLVSLYTEVSRWVSLPTPAQAEVLGRGASWWGGVLAVVGTVAVAVGYGCAVAWLRYRSFRVHLRDGELSVSGGWVSHESRRVQEHLIGGLRIDQNPAMRALGYGRLSHVSREAGRRVGTRVVLPVVPLTRLAHGVDTSFPGYAGTVAAPRGAAGPYGALVSTAAVLALCTVAALVGEVRPGLLGPAGAVLAIAVVVVVNRLWTAAELDPARSLLRYRRGFLWVRQYTLPLASVHLATYSQGPVARRLGVGTVSVFVHDGRRVRLRVVGCPEALAERVVRAVAVPPAPVRTSVLAGAPVS